MVEIIPAVLPRDFADFKEKIGIVSPHALMVHIDVTDGTLTKNSSWPYYNNTGEFERIKNEESGLPFWEETNFEVHLMVKDPENKYEEWVRAGADRLIVHLEAFENGESASEFLLKLQKYFSLRDTYFGIEVGLAVNLDTSIEKVLPHVLECDFIHLMSIKEIGSQGQSFEEEIFNKIRELKSAYPETIIAVDGGVDTENAERLVEAGAERLVVGSAIFSSDDPISALDELKSIVE